MKLSLFFLLSIPLAIAAPSEPIFPDREWPRPVEAKKPPTDRFEETLVDTFPLVTRQHHDATTGQSDLERRGEKVDRRQKDRSKPIDFSLLTPCIERCLRASNGVAPKSLDVVSLEEFCHNRADWFLWLRFGPLHCWAIHCKKQDRHLGPVAREWASTNCGW